MTAVTNQTASIAAQNTFSAGVEYAQGKAQLRLSGAWVATVTLQMSDDDGVTWYDDEETRSANGIWTVEIPHSGLRFRFGVKTGDYTSGTVAGALTQ